jgi:diadenosine tetraphosphate (Ap4A) HIT family hydrolase
VGADAELQRAEVWSDGIWRLTVALRSEVVGFSYLEPVRHIPHLEELEGIELATFGGALMLAARALKEEAGSEAVYVYIFGEGIPHLHVHLAPHHADDPLSTQIVRGDFVAHQLPGGATEFVSQDFPLLEETHLRRFADRVRRRLEGATASTDHGPPL